MDSFGLYLSFLKKIYITEKKSVNYGNFLRTKPVYEYSPSLNNFHIKWIGEHIKNIKEHLLFLRFFEKQ